MLEDLPLLTAVDSGLLQGPPRLGHGGLGRGAEAEAVEEEVADRYEAGELQGFVSFAGRGRMRTAGAT